MGGVIDSFTEWFCSRGGVWQTGLATLAVVAVELFDRRLDPHAFVLMAVLTVYSAITQPALAYAGAQAAEQNEILLKRLATLLDHHDLPVEGRDA